MGSQNIMDARFLVLTTNEPEPRVWEHKRRGYHTKDCLGCLSYKENRSKYMVVIFARRSRIQYHQRFADGFSSVTGSAQSVCAVLERKGHANIKHTVGTTPDCRSK